MRTLLLHLPIDPAAAAPWTLFDASGVTLQTGLAVDGAALATHVAAERCWVIVPGPAATAHLVDLPQDANGRRVAAAAAYALEDALAVDPAELHFALGPAGAGKRLVTVVGLSVMDGWMRRLTALGAKADILVPDFLTVAGSPVQHGDLVLATSPEAGFAAETELAAAILGPSVHAPAISTAKLLEQARVRLTNAAPVNLLQGRYAPKRDWAPILRPWRRAGVLAASIAVLALLGAGIEGVRLNRQAAAATARAEAVFRAALPDVKRVVNPRAQMRAYLQGANLAGAGGFLGLSDIVVSATAAVADAEITNLRFDSKRNEIAATFSLPSFDAVERVKGEMTARGGIVHEGGARQDGVRVLADMMVKRP